LTSQAVPPLTGVAPVTVLAGGFSINGDVVAGSAGVIARDWMAGPGGAGVLDATGAPLNPRRRFISSTLSARPATMCFRQKANQNKWTTDPNTWTWTTR
jgi:hypothetical protein